MSDPERDAIPDVGIIRHAFSWAIEPEENSMLEQIFTQMEAIERFRANPLGAYLDSYAAHVVALGYRRQSIHTQLRLIAMLGHWLDKRDIGVAGLSQPLLEKFLVTRLRGPKGRARLSDAATLARFHRHIAGEDIDANTEPHALSDFGRLISDYEQHLRNERGLATRTVIGHRAGVRTFMEYRFGRMPEHRRVLTAVGPKDVGAFFVDCQVSRSAVASIASSLRVFFRFLFFSGAISRDLAASVPSVQCTRLASVPKFFPPEQVERVLDACERTTAMGRRDYAVLMLLARLGLRGGEVRLMLLDDVDWRNGEILVRGKGKRHERLPLPRDVGRALADYVKGGRESDTRRLFVRIRAPRVGLSSTDEINRIVDRALLRAGITTRPRGVNSHLFRHSLATSMLRRGSSMAEIGLILRHESQETTSVYAKVDIEALRSIAQPWPAHRGVR